MASQDWLAGCENGEIMTPNDIERLLRRHGSGKHQDDFDEASEPVASREHRTALLQPILRACQREWTTRLDEMARSAQKLGDGSRDVAWRLPLGDSGILEIFVSILADNGVSHDLKIHSLRLVGNACADTDENRTRIAQTDYLSSIMRHIEDDSLISYTVPVLYNILVDYEPAQLLASQLGLSRRLVALLSSSGTVFNSAIASYIYKLLALLVDKEGESSEADASTVSVLLRLAARAPVNEDVEDFVSVLHTVVAYLSHESFQCRLLSERRVDLFLNVFYQLHTNFNLDRIEDSDAMASFKKLRPALLTTLANLSGHDSFASLYPLLSTVSESLKAWLQGTNAALQAAACLALGNLSRSDEIAMGLVETEAIHSSLRNILANPTVCDAQLLHLALSLCKNLAIPHQNKIRLGYLLEPSCVPRILALETLPQVQFSAISLTRLLILNCIPNVRRICTPSMNASSASLDDECSGVASIASLFDRSDAEPTKLEASRCLLALCSVLHSKSPPESFPDEHHEAQKTPFSEMEKHHENGYAKPDEIRQLLLKKYKLSSALAFLTTQNKWPSLRSEAWFVLALISRSQDGASVVNAVLDVQATTDALTQAITGRNASDTCPDVSEPGQKTPSVLQDNLALASRTAGSQHEPQQISPAQRNVAKADRENALVLATQLLKNGKQILPEPKIRLLQDLIQKGAAHISTVESRC